MINDNAIEVEKLLDETHAFADGYLKPVGLELDAFSDPEEMINAQTPLRALFQEAFLRGYHKVLLPREVGGKGLSGVERQALLEELGRGSAGLAMSLFLAGLPFKELAVSGQQDSICELAGQFAADRDGSMIGCWAVTEPHHGSDAIFIGSADSRQPGFVSQETTGRATDGGYILNGEKGPWVSNGPLATHALVSFNVEGSEGGREIAVVPLGSPGVDRGRPVPKLGQRDLAQSALSFHDVSIERRFSITGTEGYERALERIQSEIFCALAAVASGLARSALEETVSHVHSRRQGGARLSEHQAVRQQIFELFTRVEAARAMSRRAVEQAPQAQLTRSVAAKVFCTETAFSVVNDGMRLFGGVADNQLIAKLFRDARVMWAEHGSNDTLRLAGAARIL
ncbi:MAG: acyl-CoA/acyl-ACP dehydrogenase [Deltaproteobacteria bacterium]|nr:acyl-CoA/acyl-ACP dehydrogenase [Deltaproteobacteria bacterium]